MLAEQLEITYSNDMDSDSSVVHNSFIEAVSPVYSRIDDTFDFDNLERQSKSEKNRRLGVVRVGLSLSGLESKRWEMLQFSFLVSLAALFFSNIVAYLLARVFVKPIVDISYMASRVSKGDLDGVSINSEQSQMSFADSPVKLKQFGSDELGFLTESFIKMTKRIQEHQNELENEVELRTNELTQANKTLMLYRHSIEGTSDSVLITDSNANIIAANHAFLDLSGYSMEAIDGAAIETLISSKEIPVFKQLVYPSLAELGEWSGKTQLRKNNGTDNPVELSITNISDENNQSVANVIIGRDITGRVYYEEELKKLANLDSLTGLFNRRRFHEELALALEKCQQQDSKLALLCIDLDRFKVVNDTLGHQAGDVVLCDIASKLKAATRKGDIVARLGGDEFAMIAAVESEDEAKGCAKRIIDELRSSAMKINNQPFKVTSSIGISIYPDNANDSESLIANADIAMYDSKDNGRNGFSLYQERDRTAGIGSLLLNQIIGDAIEQDNLSFDMQPIIDAKTGNIVHYELLLRLLGADGKTIPPNTFIPHAEQSGVIKEIDKWVITNAIKLLAKSNAHGHEISCAINLSAHTLNETALSEFIHTQLIAADVKPWQLMLELTESAAISDYEKAQSFIKDLNAIGCQFALDDFGIGFTSFSYLKNLKVNYLKLDGSFIHNLVNEPRDICIVEGIVKVANGPGMELIAEWVEDQATLDLLTNLGIGFVQGYHTGRPYPASDFFNQK